MAKSRITQLALSVPSIRRMYQTLNRLDSASLATQVRQEEQAGQIFRLVDEIASVRSLAHQALSKAGSVAAAPPAAAASQPAGNDGELAREVDRWTAREMQGAAVRNLPFLPGEIALQDDGIRMEGYAGAPEGLRRDMAFFINGLRIDQVTYPIQDPELASRFTEVQGMGTVVRTLMTQHLDQLRAARMWRFDASPTGRYVAGNWRQAIHFMNPLMERYPMPPEANRLRVIGDTHSGRFAMGGATIMKNVEQYLGELGHSWSDFPRILDWGCGSGRVTRYMLSETGCKVTGIDIDPDNIAWCKESYPDGQFAHVPLRPPTEFADASFDLVLGLSVMTHLQENDQWLWLAELKRLVRPGGIAFLSVQGPTQFSYNRFPPHLYRQVQQHGYLDLSRDGALDAVIEDKDYYRAAMHSREYIVNRWSEYFDVVAIADAIAGMQDFVVLRRRG